MQTKILSLSSSRISVLLLSGRSRGVIHPSDKVLLPLPGRGKHLALRAGLRSGWAAACGEVLVGLVSPTVVTRRTKLTRWGQQSRWLLPFTSSRCLPGHSLTWNAASQGPVAHLEHSYCLFYLVGFSYSKAVQQKNLLSHQTLSRQTRP